MATQAEAKALATQGNNQATSLQTMIQKAARELAQALPEHMRPERIVRIALTCIRLNPELAKCTPESFMGSLFVLAQMGLEPIAGRAYLLPFNNSRKVGPNEWKTYKEVQALIGYKGLAELFYRSENALSLDMQEVRENDEFDYEYGSNSFIKHKPARGERGEVIAYYAIAKMRNNAQVFRVMSKQEVEDHGKKHSKTFSKKDNKFSASSPWVTSFDDMAKKTVLIQVAKLLPLSVEMQRAISVDETSREYRAGINDALDLPDTTSWIEQEPSKEAIDTESQAVVEPVKKQEPAVKEEPAKKEEPKPTSTLPANMTLALTGIRNRIGKEKFLEILGSCGYESIEQIPNINEANKVLAEISKKSEG